MRKATILLAPQRLIGSFQLRNLNSRKWLAIAPTNRFHTPGHERSLIRVSLSFEQPFKMVWISKDDKVPAETNLAWIFFIAVCLFSPFFFLFRRHSLHFVSTFLSIITYVSAAVIVHGFLPFFCFLPRWSLYLHMTRIFGVAWVYAKVWACKVDVNFV